MTVDLGNDQTRKERIQVRVTEIEKALITAHAKSCVPSVSDFLRNLGMGYEPKSKLDQDAIAKLADASTNLGRLGGLLKLWISEKRRQYAREPASISEIETTWAEIQTSLADLKALILQLANKK